MLTTLAPRSLHTSAQNRTLAASQNTRASIKSQRRAHARLIFGTRNGVPKLMFAEFRVCGDLWHTDMMALGAHVTSVEPQADFAAAINATAALNCWAGVRAHTHSISVRSLHPPISSETERVAKDAFLWVRGAIEGMLQRIMCEYASRARRHSSRRGIGVLLLLPSERVALPLIFE